MKSYQNILTNATTKLSEGWFSQLLSDVLQALKTTDEIRKVIFIEQLLNGENVKGDAA